MTTYEVPQTRQSIDALAFVAFVLIAFGGLMIFRDVSSRKAEPALAQDVDIGAGAIEPLEESNQVGSGRDLPQPQVDNSIFAPPYNDYTLTQGPHGFSYGHMAIDIAAGKDAKIKSPINGEVTALYVDEYGNPTLVIENEFYQVTMLHGKYKVSVGDQLEVGQMVGRESNIGYTTDINGRSCKNRECGYHTHLNVFDKRLGENVNPLVLMGE
jgi:murein DD-endopeptidase MepM/ murein hydrolase activator NlpD